ncbi:MFS transporter [Kytococcus sedentarius]|uniref:MFS transporter n=1 Tax=Kytococcus sedentarius TaxID=1276 RepID=UPI0035BC666E
MLRPVLTSAPQVAALFTINGFMIGIWGGLLASLRDRIGIHEGDVSLLLVTVGFSAAVTMQVSGRLADRIGARRPTIVGAVVMMVAFAVLAAATSWPMVLVAACLLGLGNGAMDVSMNALAVSAERVARRRIMSTLHAFFSMGSLAGASAVLAANAVTSGPGGTVVVATLGAIVLVAGLLVSVSPRTPDTPIVSHHDEAGGRTRLPAITWLLAAMAVLFGITEGTGWDWSTIHVTDVAGVSPGLGAAGLAVFSAAMVALRLSGDLLVERLGARPVLVGGALLAAVGYLVAATQESFAVVLAAWALVGVGVAVLAPMIYGMAGHLGGGRMLAVVAGAGYLTFLAGPALIGWASTHWGMGRAMFVPLTTAAMVAVLAAMLPRRAQEAAVAEAGE